jgi:hypothetical protein
MCAGPIVGKPIVKAKTVGREAQGQASGQRQQLEPVLPPEMTVTLRGRCVSAGPIELVSIQVEAIGVETVVRLNMPKESGY